MESTSAGHIGGLHRRAASKGYILIDAGTEISETPPLLGHTGTIIVRCPAENRMLSFRCSSMDEHREWFNQITAVIEGAVNFRRGGQLSRATFVRRLSGSFVTSAGGKLSRLETFQSEQSSSKGMPSSQPVPFSSSDEGADEGNDEGGDCINMAGPESEGGCLPSRATRPARTARHRTPCTTQTHQRGARATWASSFASAVRASTA